MTWSWKRLRRQRSVHTGGQPRDLSQWRLNTDRFLRVLQALVAVGERLQNSPSQEQPPPREDLSPEISCLTNCQPIPPAVVCRWNG